MNRLSPTYRYLVVLIAVTIFAGASLPVSLHAIGMDVFCIMNVQDQQHAASGMLCEWNSRYGSADHLKHNQEETPDCTLQYSCGCTVDNTEGKKDAIIHGAKYKVILPSKEDGIAAGLQAAPCHGSINPPNQTASPPPIYLLNSAFLN